MPLILWLPLAKVLRMAFNKTAFESACARFREAFTGFEDFQNPGELYLNQERNYKVELKKIFSDKLVPLMDAHPAEFVRMFLRIMNQRLDSIGEPQNLVSWRALALLDKLGDRSSPIGERLQEVLRAADGGPEELSASIDAFGNAAKLLIRRPAAIRELVTFPLMFHRTGEHIALRLTYWNRCGRILSGGPLIKVGSVVTGAEVFRCLDLAREIRQKLNDAGWRVQDMIDVQSFVFEITRTRRPEEPVPSPPTSSIEAIAEYVETNGMRIQDRTLRRYHHSLRSRGFVILAGPSGTGKTWLTKLYADAVRARYFVASVAPNWVANEDLLGYFNPIDNVFHATPFLKFIDAAANDWEAKGNDAADFHLVLDEMNLARVEHYFSLFLSLMERRRGGVMPEQPLAGDRIVRVPPNLKFVGTVNMDETTHGFSDKLLDRAQLIELPVSREAVKAHVAGALYEKVILALWDAMSDVCPFGFRVLDDIAAYTRLADQDGVAWQEALDEQIVSKLLPKLRGIEPAVRNALEQVIKVVQVNKEVDGQFELAEAKCKLMLRRYEDTRAVSFF